MYLNCYDEDNIFNASIQQVQKIENPYNMEGPKGSEVGFGKKTIYPYGHSQSGYTVFNRLCKILLNNLSNKT